jgi:hypothetical protein
MPVHKNGNSPGDTLTDFRLFVLTRRKKFADRAYQASPKGRMTVSKLHAEAG